jgi:RHH-type proline utilization regulon transcriptional repressor/proline dehydrogenase/delta 1-pyrroline-5-carboxylate dehydrogenase
MAIHYPELSTPLASTAPVTPTTLGKKIFALVGSERPSTFNLNFWATKMMNWSMSDPRFKVNLFRLVDVLPQLRSQAAVASHVREYLGNHHIHLRGIERLGSLLQWGLRAPPGSLRGNLVAYVVKRSVEQMAGLFIAGENPSDAVPALRSLRSQGLAFTVDLLGEFSVSEREANIYVDRYLDALEVLGRAKTTWPEATPLVEGHPGEQSPCCISVKLTALYSQCSPLNFERSVEVLSDKLSTIVRKARSVGAQVYVDAEDTGNNPIIYAVYKKVFGSPEFRDIPFPGAVVQAYAKSSGELVDDLLAFAKARGAPIAIRLVKGAYWDQETISAKANGWETPLYAHKQSSDANYEALTRKLIDEHEHVLPAFGSHNVRSLAHACSYAYERGLSNRDFELQMLFGMAEPIARAFAAQGTLVRMYVPLGDMIVGMGYLVRRLLENTSNESFLRHTFFDSDEIEELLSAPAMHPEDHMPPSPKVANYV